MHFTGEEISVMVGSYLWPFIRIAAMITAMPVFSSNFIPVRVRLMIAIGITIVVAPVIPEVPHIDALSPRGFYVILQQMIIGITMGFIFHLVFSVFIIAGQIVAMQMGLGFAMMVDPVNGSQAPVLGMFYMVLVTLFFLLLDGHLILISVMADSFYSLPIGMEGLVRENFNQMVEWGSHMFSGAVLVALPAIIALLLINVSLGVMGRAAPQLNIFAIGFAITIIAGFYVIMVTLPAVLVNLEDMSNQAMQEIKGFTKQN